MNSKRLTFCGSGILYLVLAWVNPVQAYLDIKTDPAPTRVAMTDCVVRGQIMAAEEKLISARLFPFQPHKLDFKVYSFEVTEIIRGLKEAKTIRIAFVDMGLKSKQYKPVPKAGQKGCVYGVKHSEENFFVVAYGCFIDDQNPDYEKELELTRRCAKLLSKPETGLKAKQVDDRLLTAYLLAYRFQMSVTRRYHLNVKAEPVSAELSKLLLLALKDADWTKPIPGTHFQPYLVLIWLNLEGNATGPSLPKSFPKSKLPFNNELDPDSVTAIRKWLQDNSDKRRAHRFVPLQNDPKK